MRSDDFVLAVALTRPGRVLSPNSRSHWTAKQRVVRESRGRARLLMLKQKREAERICLLPEGWSPSHYDVVWFFWGGTGPDADNALASCKAYLDGCCDALGVNDRVLDCAGIHRVKDREQAGTVLIRFYKEESDGKLD